jgi:putative ABC transport system permease protein
LIDVPDENRESRAQGPAAGLAVDLLSPGSSEIGRLNLLTGLRQGRLPEQRGEVLLSDEFARKLGVAPGDVVTLISSTMSGSMALQNFRIAGTVRFGAAAMDRGAMLLDLLDAKELLDMHDAAGEILGYDPSGFYNIEHANAVTSDFRQRYGGSPDRFAPVMFTLREQNDMAAMIDYIDIFASLIVVIFMGVLSIILWNAGLIGGLRRYGEVGLRLAIGEDKNHLYRSMLVESAAVGVAGSIAGTVVGLGIAYLLETVGFDFSDMMKSASMVMPAVFRARVTETAYYIGFIPGVLSTLLGTALSGIGIYRRQTASLFKELEV